MHIDVDVVVVFRDTEMNTFYLAQLDVVWLGLLISLCSNFWSASHLVLMLCVLFVFILLGLGFSRLFVESLILAQDERWRRA